ncbi:MAG: AAA family ATPase [Bacteroidetes bacterium]|nr:AAA family ATPase [Bacteroidota bacterium]
MELTTATAKQLIDMKITKIPTLLEDLLPQTGLVVLSGPSEGGKSTFARQLAIEIVIGKDKFLGININAIFRRAIYVSTEDDSNALSALLNAYNHSEEEKVKLENLRYIFDSENILEDIEKYLVKNPVDLVVVDIFTDLYSGDLNMTNKVRGFLNKFRKLSLKYKCLILCIHHPNKRSDSEAPNKNNLLGSQGIEAKARLVLDLRKESANPNYRRLYITKGNYISDERKKFGLRLRMNDNQIYDVVDNEIPIRNSSASMIDNINKQNKKIERVHELNAEEKPVREIVSIMKDEGFDISVGSVQNYKQMECSTVQAPIKSD